jgi:hypothetical protein
MKTVFWDVQLYSLVERLPWWWRRQALWNVGKILPDYMGQHSKKKPSLYSPPWEPENSPCSSVFFSNAGIHQPVHRALQTQNKKKKSLTALKFTDLIQVNYNFSWTHGQTRRFRPLENKRFPSWTPGDITMEPAESSAKKGLHKDQKGHGKYKQLTDLLSGSLLFWNFTTSSMWN